MTRVSVILLVLFAAASASADAVDELAAAIEARLLLMPDVARYKWNHGLPVTDPARESALLDQIAERAAALSIPPSCARAVMQAQLTASRAWQSDLVERWRGASRAPFEGVPDLATKLRPAIDAATERVLSALRPIGCTLDSAGARRLAATPAALAHQQTVWATAVAPWMANAP